MKPAVQASAGRSSEQRLRELAAELGRTQRGTLGRPHTFVIAPDRRRILFLRAVSGHDPRQCLWSIDTGTGEERCLVDPSTLDDEAEQSLPPAERDRRQRAREQARGIVAYATDRDATVAAFALAGQLHVADLHAGQVKRLGVPGPVVDPRPSPTGQHVAWVADGALYAATITGTGLRTIAAERESAVSWGLAEFIAAEEMGRGRGFWWSPDGSRVVATRVDTSRVTRWHIANPIEPATPPAVHPYPAAGTANADVRVAVIGIADGRVDVRWDREAFPYLAAVRWDPDAPLTVVVQSRDQREVAILTADHRNGQTRTAATVTGRPWVELVPGAPRWLPDGRLLTVQDDPDTDSRRAFLDGVPSSPAGLQVRAVSDADAHQVIVVASDADPTATGVWRIPTDGSPPEPVTETEGTHQVTRAHDLMVVTQHARLTPTVRTTVRGNRRPLTIRSLATSPSLRPRIDFAALGPTGLRTVLLLPSWFTGGELPVLLDPYGGPHAQRVLQAADGFLTSQWFAEAGFAVLVADGRGTPGRGPSWEHAVAGDLGGPVLDDQITALHAAAGHWPYLDLSRVAIRGWSFGGFLAALAVLRRPDVFHAAVAGAPVTDWRLYDTHYTERYLGQPQDNTDAYERSSLLADAHRLCRPLLLLHGLADDNVVMAHSLRLSQALLEAGRPHTVMPLSGVTHMAGGAGLTARLLELQLAFLRKGLGLSDEEGEGERQRAGGRGEAGEGERQRAGGRG